MFIAVKNYHYNKKKNWLLHFGKALSKSATMLIKELLFRKRLLLISFYCKHQRRTKNMMHI